MTIDIEMREPAERELDAWYRKLKDDRIEIMLKSPELRIRASGPATDIWELVEWFEDQTERKITGDWERPPRKGSKPPAGQLSIAIAGQVQA